MITAVDWFDDLERGWYQADEHLHPADEWVQSWLRTKHEVAVRLKPRRICEFGVRAGYSAFSLLAAVPDAEYRGIDNYSDAAWGGTSGAADHARRLLSRFPHARLEIGDSHDIALLDGVYDLVHIDGDHSTAGCIADLLLAERSCARWVLVDDTRDPNTVREGLDWFLDARALEAEWIDDGRIGSALVRLS